MKSPEVVFLLDCDNTLLDSDRVVDDLRAHLASEFGPESRDRYWEIFETLREELGYADYLGALQRSGLWQAVEGRVLIYIHKEQMLADVGKRYPARHYVMVDDKLRILTAMKQTLRDRLTTVFPRQGRYALDPHNLAAYPPADLTIARIGDLLDYDLPALTMPARTVGREQETT